MKNKKAKKYITFVLVLWLLGIAGYAWVALDKENEKKLLEEHSQKFDANLNRMDKMITGEEDFRDISQVVPDENWQAEFARYQKRNSTIRPLVTSAATGSVALGGLLLIFWGISKVYNSKAISLMRQESSLFSTTSHQSSGVINQPEQLIEKTPEKVETPTLKKPQKGISKLKGHDVTDILSNRSAYDFENINVMYCDEETANLVRKVDDSPVAKVDTKAFDKLEENIRNTIISGYSDHVNKVDESLKAQSENLEKQVMEMRT